MKKIFKFIVTLILLPIWMAVFVILIIVHMCFELSGSDVDIISNFNETIIKKWQEW